MKIILFTNDINFFLSHRSRLASFLIEYGYEVIIACDMRNMNQSIEEFLLKGINFQHFEIDRKSLNPVKIIISAFKFRKYLKKISPTHILCVSAKPNLIGGLGSYLINSKKFFVISGLGFLFINDSFKNLFIRKLVLWVYKIIFNNNNAIFQNEDDLKLFIKKRVIIREQAVKIEGNGIDLNTFKFIEREKDINNSTFLFASRLLIDKGINEFITVASELLNENIKFFIAGKVDNKNPRSISSEYLEEKVSSIQNLNYLGSFEYSEMPELFSLYDFFVLPSYREGLPQVALEAASTGLPLIMSNVPGCNSCVEVGINGFLCEPRETDSLKTAILSAHTERDYQEMSKNSRKLIENRFSTDVIFSEYLKIFLQ